MERGPDEPWSLGSGSPQVQGEGSCSLSGDTADAEFGGSLK